jgi:hypothetical protein
VQSASNQPCPRAIVGKEGGERVTGEDCAKVPVMRAHLSLALPLAGLRRGRESVVVGRRRGPWQRGHLRAGEAVALIECRSTKGTSLAGERGSSRAWVALEGVTHLYRQVLGFILEARGAP